MNRSLVTEQLVTLYKEWSSVPTVKWASLFRTGTGDLSIQSKWTFVNVSQMERTGFNRFYFSQGTTSTITFSPVGFPTDSTQEKISAISPSANFRAIIRKTKDKKGDLQQYFEIWRADLLGTNLDLNALDFHGEVNDDGQFGCLEWSPDERRLVYVAEKKQSEKSSFFSQKTLAEGKELEQGLGEYCPDWGEQLVGKHHPVACILDVHSSKVTVVNLGDKSCGQVVWGPKGEGLVCVGFEEEPRRLGIIFCTNRKSSLYYVDVKNGNQATVLHSREGWSCLSPRLSPDDRTLVFLEVPDRGPHRACARLCKMDWSSKEVTVVVEVVSKATGSEFPGLYCDGIISHCFSLNSRHVFLTSYWRSKKELLSVDLKTNQVKRITNDPTIGSWTLCDLMDNMAVAVCSSPSLKPHLVFANLSSYLSEGQSPKWIPLEATSTQIPDVSWKILQFQPDDTPDEAMKIESVLITPTLKKDHKFPLVVIPHGGPHSVTEASFYYSQMLFVKLGFAVLLVNYRGSLGFGDAPLRHLLGKVGDADVKDVQQCVLQLAKETWVDSQRVALSGGSHGGFLAAHLIGQYPNTFRACVCRNPVVDISGKMEGTDIPDWGFVESGQGEKFSFSYLPTPEIRQKMWACSPYQYVSQVKTPILLLIGCNDLRVPPTQGINYYHTLKAMGKVTNLYVYKDNHSLSSASVDSDAFVRLMLWFYQHLDIKI